MGFLEQILEYRQYAAAWRQFQTNPAAEGELMDRVREIQFALVQAAIDAEK